MFIHFSLVKATTSLSSQKKFLVIIQSLVLVHHEQLRLIYFPFCSMATEREHCQRNKKLWISREREWFGRDGAREMNFVYRLWRNIHRKEHAVKSAIRCQSFSSFDRIYMKTICKDPWKDFFHSKTSPFRIFLTERNRRKRLSFSSPLPISSLTKRTIRLFQGLRNVCI